MNTDETQIGKDEWVDRCAAELIRCLFPPDAPPTEKQKRNMRKWAEEMYANEQEHEEFDRYDTPEECAQEDMRAGL